MLGFNETMFCNLFFTEPDRERILENLEQAAVPGKYADGFTASDLLSDGGIRQGRRRVYGAEFRE